MLLGIPKRIIIYAFIIFSIILYYFLWFVFDQYEYSTRMLETYGPICVKSAIADFQTEDVSVYTPNGETDYSAGVSPNFNDYLVWLRSNGGDLSPLSDSIRYEFVNYGVTPMNYSLPYIDEDILRERASQYLDEQLRIRSTEDWRCQIDNARIEIIDISREVKPISTSGIWGNNSTFYTATGISTGTSTDTGQLYEYQNYIQYFINCRVHATISLELPIRSRDNGAITIVPRDIEYTFVLPYELVN